MYSDIIFFGKKVRITSMNARTPYVIIPKIVIT